ncbi:hypothetical protein DPMN_044503 [Dreissena polymorpha]|uniref:Uncharacterized protein n=1 Tax=Dreissena polymorpha TaxID=45954 RepID=A0A9D4HWI8_DREPO|nr:hypothetical protein DPMN_044503 [Dreissena polymorpha]
MEEAKVGEEAMRLNRFLALAGFEEGGSLDNSCVWKDHLEIADSYFQMKDFAPGTARSILGSAIKFVRWAKDERMLDASIADEVCLQ